MSAGSFRFPVSLVALAICACSQSPANDQSPDHVNMATYDVAESPSPSDGSANDVSRPTDGPEFNSWDFGGSAQDPTAEVSSPETQVWVGMSGVSAGCSLTNYQSVDDAAAVLEQNGASVLRRSPNLVILAEKAPSGELKSVFATSEALCENIATSTAFAGSADSPSSERAKP